jgi:hypothetical protein
LIAEHNAATLGGEEVLEASAPPEQPVSFLEMCYYGEQGTNLPASSEFERYQQAEQLFPRIAVLARKYLAIPATSIPSERIFSSAGNTITEKRNRLTPEHAAEIIFLHENSLCTSE